MTTDYKRMQQIRGSTNQWVSDNIVPLDGEITIERAADGDRLKVGDGSTPYSALAYVIPKSPVVIKGNIDATASVPPTAAPGDLYINTGTGPVAAGWGAPAAGTSVVPGDELLRNSAGQWAVVPTGADMTGYVSKAALAAATGSALVGFQAPGSSQVVTVESKLDRMVSLADYMTSAQRTMSNACKSFADPAPDMTSVLQNLINNSGTMLKLEVPTPVAISSQITVPDGKNVYFHSPAGNYQHIAGGYTPYTGGVFRWTGTPNSVMFLLDTVNGSCFDGIFFETQSTDRLTIQIPGVTLIRHINNGASHFNRIENCYFSRCQYAIHYFDAGGTPTNDFNLDSQIILNCGFDSYEDALRVEQSNVYDSSAYRCSFFGSSYYARHHLHIVKGHYNIDGSFFGGMHDGSHYGGVKDGVAIYIEKGYANITNCHSEIKNGPMLDWVAPMEANDTVNLFGFEDQTETASNYASYEVINRTANTLNIIGGSMTGVPKQAGAGGQINMIGVGGIGTCDPTSLVDQITYIGRRNSRPGAFGTLPGGSGAGLGGGQATLEGNDPALTIFDRIANSGAQIKYTGGLLQFNKPGTVSGPYIDFAGRYLALQNPDFAIRCPVRAMATITAIWPSPPDGLTNIVCSDLTLPYTGTNIGATAVGGGTNVGPISRLGGRWVIG
jgi:hypothetical protein